MSQDLIPTVTPWNVLVAPGSPAEEAVVERSQGAPAAGQLPAVLARGLPPTPAHDLRFNGGKTIADLVFVNLYVGGNSSWKSLDIAQIDRALSAALADVRLNNVMAQYFPGRSISGTMLPSHILADPPAPVVSQGDVESLLTRLFVQSALPDADVTRTVFNFLLPSGVVLNTETTVTGGRAPQPTASPGPAHAGLSSFQSGKGPTEREDSLNGLGGYHGSVHVSSPSGASVTLYYAVGAYSEVMADGRVNGIPAFAEPWKNVVATFYHELQEARTDADVGDAIRTGQQSFTGWVSDQGEECGDFPVFEANPLSLVFQEVPLADGSGTVPVQFQYSNAVHGPEGPIDLPHSTFG